MTALVPPDLAVPLRLHVNDASLAPGDTLTLTVKILPEATPRVVDLYVALQLPDQSLWFLHADGSFTPEIRPYLRQWPVVPVWAEVFRYTLTGAELPGPYKWLAALTEPGTGTIVGAWPTPRLPSAPRLWGRSAVPRPGATVLLLMTVMGRRLHLSRCRLAQEGQRPGET